MICNWEYRNISMKADTDRIAKIYVDQGRMIVFTASIEERDKLIDYLEKRGFVLTIRKEETRQQIIESVFPLDVNLKHKIVAGFGNVTTSAAAASQGIIINVVEFYLLYSVYELLQSVEQ